MVAEVSAGNLGSQKLGAFQKDLRQQLGANFTSAYKVAEDFRGPKMDPKSKRLTFSAGA